MIPPEHEEALVAAIEDLRADLDRRRRMGERGREFVLKGHLRPVLARRMVDELVKVIGIGHPVMCSNRATGADSSFSALRCSRT